MPPVPLLVHGYYAVAIYRNGERIARHERLWTRGDASYDPLHYLELLERKPGALDHARPFEGWELPECFDDRESWELLVEIKGIAHGAENRDKAKAVRRSQKGRAEKPEASVGDQCYGYGTELDDPNWTYSKENPRPRKHNLVKDKEAKWVLEIFRWFVVLGWSISKITRELNRQGAPKRPWTDKNGRRQRRAWHHHQVRRLLSNEKLIGRWPWGKTRTVRNSRGKKKQLPVPEKDVGREIERGLRATERREQGHERAVTDAPRLGVGARAQRLHEAAELRIARDSEREADVDRTARIGAPEVAVAGVTHLLLSSKELSRVITLVITGVRLPRNPPVHMDLNKVVEDAGIEPATSRLPASRSPS
jgi:hypothetical protein